MASTIGLPHLIDLGSIKDEGIPNEVQLTQWQTQLLEWSANHPEIISKIEERTIDLPSGKFYSFNLVAHSHVLNRKFVGIGRSRVRLTAAARAIGESIERIVGAEILSDPHIKANHEIKVFSHLPFEVTELSSSRLLPSPGLRSSNGWAVHYSKRMAIEAALNEALERHILYLTYLRSGWDDFDYFPGGSVLNIEVGSLIGRVAVAGRKAGIAVSHIEGLPGFAMGYCCDLADQFHTSSKWEQGFFESIETALYYSKNQFGSGTWANDYGYQILQAYQEYYLGKTAPPWIYSSTSGRPSIENTDSMSASILLIDVAKALNMPFPFYASYIFGGDFIPLFFKQRLDKVEASFVQDILSKFNLSTLIPEFHPVI